MIELDVEIDENAVLGVYVNAFRVTEGREGCILEFLVFSRRAKKAEVVSRVHVRRAFIPNIKKTLDESLEAS